MRRGFILPVFLIVFLVVIGSAYLIYSKSQNYKSEIASKDSTIQQLNEQIDALRDYRTPKPSQPPDLEMLSKEVVIEPSLASANLYQLDCFDDEKKVETKYSWYLDGKKSFEEGEKLAYFCFNKAQNHALFFANKEVDRGGFGRPNVFEFRLYLVHPIFKQLQLQGVRSGTYLGGWCNKITAWTKKGEIYYECGGGDGAAGGQTNTYKFLLGPLEVIF